MNSRSDTAHTVLITDAQRSRIDEHNSRRRRYAITMGVRILCLILAGVFYETLWLMFILVGLSCVLPWAAVLIANDRPPKKAEQVNRHAGAAPERTLGSADASRTIEG